MAQSKFIQSVVDAAKGRPKSTQWYRDKIAEFGKPGAMDLIRDGKRNNKPFYGRLNMFFYDPKHKETLPYYDQFPLIFVLGDAPGGFLGMNLHYLPPLLRQKLLKALLDLASNDKYNKRTKLMLSYDLLKGSSKYAAFKPTIKHYLTSHVKTRLAKVPAAEWEIAIFLPMAQWKKASATQVYRDSRKMI